MKILGSLGELVSKRPLAVVIGSIVFTVLLMAGAGIAFVTGHTELRTNINDLFPEYEEVLILNAIVEDFGDSDAGHADVRSGDVCGNCVRIPRGGPAATDAPRYMA